MKSSYWYEILCTKSPLNYLKQFWKGEEGLGLFFVLEIFGFHVFGVQKKTFLLGYGFFIYSYLGY